MTNKAQIVAKAILILEAQPHGLRYSQLVSAIQGALPDAKQNTITGSIWNLESQYPKEVFKPARGMYIHTKFREPDGLAVQPAIASVPAKPRVREEQFYEA